MAKVKLWNDNDHEHREVFKGDEIVIPAKGFIEMDFEDAVDLKGQFTPVRFIRDGVPDPKSFKMLRHDWPKQHATRPDDALRCHADGSTAGSVAELAERLAAFANQRVTDPELDAELKKQKESDAAKISGLEAQVAELKAQFQALAEQKAPRRAAAGA